MDSTIAVLVLICLGIYWIFIDYPRDDVKLPVLRKRGRFFELLTSFELASRGPQLFMEGYKKFKDTGFVFHTLGVQNTVISKMEHILQLGNASEKILCSNGFSNYILQGDYTLLGHFDSSHGYTRLSASSQRMANIVREKLGNGEWMETIWNELGPAWRDEAEIQGVVDEQWTSVEVNTMAVTLISRVANRVIVGRTLNTNKEFLSIMGDFAKACVTTAEVVKLFPEFLRPLVHRVYNRTSWYYRKSEEMLDELISDTFEKTRAGLIKPEDESFLQWMIARETKTENTPQWRKDMARNTILINFGAIHTTAIHLTKVMYELAAHPTFITTLRAEAASKIAENNGVVDYATLEKMWTLDSFIKEVQRLYPQSASTVPRLVMQPYTFSDGVSIPAGSFLHVNGGAILRDDAYYPDASTFDGARFLKLRLAATTEEETNGFRFTDPSPTMTVFGYGRRTCPGRWMASMEIRCAVVRLLMEYDLELEAGGKPAGVTFGTVMVPDPKGRLRMRKRKRVGGV